MLSHFKCNKVDLIAQVQVFYFPICTGSSFICVIYDFQIVTYVSLDWLQCKEKHWELDSFLLTSFDLLLHVWNVYYLMEFLSFIRLLFCIVFAVIWIVWAFFGSTSYWSNPNNIPPRVQRRIKKFILHKFTTL